MPTTSNITISSRLKFIFYLLVILTIFSLFSIVKSAVGGPFYVAKSLKSNVSYMLPQGWAFFTRDAREEKLYAFAKDNNGNYIQDQPGGSAIYLFGLDRSGRKIQMEYSRLLNQVDSTEWTEAKFDLKAIATELKSKKIIRVKNLYNKNGICGEMLFIHAKIKPWAWSAYDSVKVDAKYLRIYVNCNSK